jgi:hypothetical protein
MDTLKHRWSQRRAARPRLQVGGTGPGLHLPGQTGRPAEWLGSASDPTDNGKGVNEMSYTQAWLIELWRVGARVAAPGPSASRSVATWRADLITGSLRAGNKGSFLFLSDLLTGDEPGGWEVVKHSHLS